MAGNEYLAVLTREVFQDSSGRRGDEVLLLGGVRPSALSDGGAELLTRLRDYRDRAHAAAVEQVAWERQAGLLVESEALSKWVRAIQSDAGTLVESDAPEQGVSVWPRRRVACLLFAVAVVVMGLGLFWQAGGQNGPNAKDGGKAETGGKKDKGGVKQSTGKELFAKLRDKLKDGGIKPPEGDEDGEDRE